MNLLIRNAVIIEKNSPLHRKKRDILIENGVITKIATKIQYLKKINEIILPKLHVSIGWFDSSVSFGEPGYEERETLENGLLTAAKSGFTAVAVNPITQPIIDNKTSIDYLIKAAETSPTDLYPIGAFTKGATGIEMAEFYDMKQAGAIAFNDYKRAIENPNLLKVALQYSKAFDGLLMSFPQDKMIDNNAVANESESTIRIGLKGSPSIAEEIQISRDLFILEYTGGRLHIPTISTKNSVKLIRDAQKKGLNVSCSVSAHHLCLTDKELNRFNSNFKVSPPLRTSKDTKALQKGVKDCTIQLITSDHHPIDIENKKKEFALSKSGTIGLESFFGVLNSIFDLDDFIAQISINARKLFNLKVPQIKEGETANLTFFNPDKSYTFNEQNILSSSKNSAFIGKELKGDVYGIFNKNKLILK